MPEKKDDDDPKPDKKSEGKPSFQLRDLYKAMRANGNKEDFERYFTFDVIDRLKSYAGGVVKRYQNGGKKDSRIHIPPDYVLTQQDLTECVGIALGKLVDKLCDNECKYEDQGEKEAWGYFGSFFMDALKKHITNVAKHACQPLELRNPDGEAIEHPELGYEEPDPDLERTPLAVVIEAIKPKLDEYGYQIIKDKLRGLTLEQIGARLGWNRWKVSRYLSERIYPLIQQYYREEGEL